MRLLRAPLTVRLKFENNELILLIAGAPTTFVTVIASSRWLPLSAPIGPLVDRPLMMKVDPGTPSTLADPGIANSGRRFPCKLFWRSGGAVGGTNSGPVPVRGGAVPIAEQGRVSGGDVQLKGQPSDG